MSITADIVPNTLAKYEPINPKTLVIDFERSEGSWIYDLATGLKYLDCYGFDGVLPLGINHPAYTARPEGWEPVPPYKFPHQKAFCCQYATFMDKFAQILPKHLQHFALYDNEYSAAADCIGIALRRHDDSITLGLEDTFYDYPLLKVGSPVVSSPMTADQEYREKCSLNEIKGHAEIGNTGAIVIEPIQDTGGNNLFREEYLKSVRKLADENDFLLIFDETRTGFGVSGKWWCFETYGIEPDMFIFGGKAQVCGIAWNEKVNEKTEISNGWGGSLYDMDRCLYIMHAIQKENLIENTKRVGEYLITKLRSLQAISAFVSNSRGVGTLVAFDLPNPVIRDKVLGKLKKNVLIGPAGLVSIKFRPALTFTKGDVDTLLEFIKESLK